MNRTNLKIFLGVCALCGIGCTIYYYISKTPEIRKEAEKSLCIISDKITTEKEDNKNPQEQIQTIIVFTENKELGELAKQKRTETVREELESQGFKNIKILLSKSLSATATREQLNTLKETRKDITILERN